MPEVTIHSLSDLRSGVTASRIGVPLVSAGQGSGVQGALSAESVPETQVPLLPAPAMGWPPQEPRIQEGGRDRGRQDRGRVEARQRAGLLDRA